MPPLTTEHRSLLEQAVVKARFEAEGAAKAALKALAVDQDRPTINLSEDQRRLRNALRAKQRQLGDFDLLAIECAYEQWHQMLFARFLAENNLLMHPSGVPVSLEECVELAHEEGEQDEWVLATSYAAQMLPGIFKETDPCAKLKLLLEGRGALERIVTQLPKEIFLSDDGLGWVYQFWQSEKKKEVNKSERKIGGQDLYAVTQLFTEHYMVQFLLENSLGAWWAARHPDSPLIKEFTYLRFKDDGTPAAGTFSGWPATVKELTVMDPCCGSGHFLVAAFEMLRKMRIEEEGLSETAAGDAVLKDNIHGLEIDPRCVQIAAFALAMAAWKSGGYRPLATPNLACSGIPITTPLSEWVALAKGDYKLEQALEQLHSLFKNADTLGSLINPRKVAEYAPLTTASFDEVQPLLEDALAKDKDDPVAAVFGEAAVGMAKAADLLSRQCTLVVTNVPYLKRGKQEEALKKYCDIFFKDSKAGIETAFLERCRQFSAVHGSYSIVVQQNWLFLGTYKKLRKKMLTEQAWGALIRLGSGAFETISGAVVNAVLMILTNEKSDLEQQFSEIDVSLEDAPRAKASAIRKKAVVLFKQADQLANPDARIAEAINSDLPMLSAYADGFAGVQTGDYPRFGRKFWEIDWPSDGWVFQQSTVKETVPWKGLEHALLWENGSGALRRFVEEKLGGNVGAWLRGTDFAGKQGVAVSSMTSLPVSLYSGDLFDNNTAAVIPKSERDLPAIWAFCSSPEFTKAVRRIDRKLNVTNATLVKVPFDLEHWQRIAQEKYPDGLPEPYSNDPTQWLFLGDPTDSTRPLQVAVARLLGYCWPDQEPDELDGFADNDGIVCLPAVVGERPAADRLRDLLATAYKEEWSNQLLAELLEIDGAKGKALEDWLRDVYFKNHCALFHKRPFIWHIWDGLKDGFSALVNYHKLDHPTLERLTYTILGTWIERQRADAKEGVTGAENRLLAATKLKEKLEAIIIGEPPFDTYVRWKDLSEQPLGWDPDINDGVRLNIRPFVEAKILRSSFTINWTTDRGKNPDGSARENDIHVTLAEKRAARAGVVRR